MDMTLSNLGKLVTAPSVNLGLVDKFVLRISYFYLSGCGRRNSFNGIDFFRPREWSSLTHSGLSRTTAAVNHIGVLV